MQLHVHIHVPPEEHELQYLKEHINSKIQITTGADVPSPADYEILIAGRPSQRLLDASDALHSLIIPWAGIPPTTRELMQDYPHVEIHNLHYNASSTAEFAMALLLTAAKNLIPIDRNFRNHDWRDRYAPNPSVLLEGKRALILGYGQIGQKIAQMCLGFGMEVTAIRYSIQSSERDGVVQVHPPPELHKALGSCDILFISLPETSETRGWIGKEEIGRLSDDAILINIARGSIVDERALYEALSLGKLAAAGLDVWYQYPEDQEDRENCPPSAFPFHELDNVVMSPHRAGGWEGSGLGRMDHLIQLLNQAVLGEPLDNRVDLDRGY